MVSPLPCYGKKKNLFLSFKSQKKTPLGTLVLDVRAGLSHGAVIYFFIITSAVLESITMNTTN